MGFEKEYDCVTGVGACAAAGEFVYCQFEYLALVRVPSLLFGVLG
jgi:hypothetical protein